MRPAFQVCLPGTKPAEPAKETLKQSRSSAGGGNAVASEPLTVTATREHQLRELGLSDADISELTPDEAHNLLKQGPSPQAGELKPVYTGNRRSAGRTHPRDAQ